MVVLVGCLGISAVRSVGSDLNDVGTNTLPSIMALNDVRSLMVRVQRDIRQVILSDDKKEIDALLATITTNLKGIDAAWTRYKALPLSDAERQSATAALGDGLAVDGEGLLGGPLPGEASRLDRAARPEIGAKRLVLQHV